MAENLFLGVLLYGESEFEGIILFWTFNFLRTTMQGYQNKQKSQFFHSKSTENIFLGFFIWGTRSRDKFLCFIECEVKNTEKNCFAVLWNNGNTVETTDGRGKVTGWFDVWSSHGNIWNDGNTNFTTLWNGGNTHFSVLRPTGAAFYMITFKTKRLNYFDYLVFYIF